MRPHPLIGRAHGRLPVAIVAGILIGGAISAGPANAHSGLERSSVRHGSTVRALPASITLRFAEAPLRVRRVTLIRAGKNYAGAVRTRRGNRRVVTVRTRTRPRGTRLSGRAPARSSLTGRYRLTWEIQAVDGHLQRGVVVFKVGRRAT